MPLASTTDEVWSWNGTSLNQPMWDTVTIGGSRLGLPTLRGQDVEIAYRSGKQWRSKFPDSRTITFVMWAAGVDSTTGNPAADQRLSWNNNFQTLRSIFWTRGALGSIQGTLTRLWYLTQGGTTGLVSASALGEVAGTMEPSMTGRTRADFSVDILLSDPYFYGAQVTKTLPINVAQTVNNFGEGTCGEGQPSALNVFTLQLNGPLTVPTVTNSTAGVSVTYFATVPSGVSVTLDLISFLATDTLGNNQVANVAHAGARAWFVLLGSGDGSPVNTCTLTTINGSDSGNAVLTYSPPYL